MGSLSLEFTGEGGRTSTRPAISLYPPDLNQVKKMKLPVIGLWRSSLQPCESKLPGSLCLPKGAGPLEAGQEGGPGPYPVCFPPGSVPRGAGSLLLLYGVGW